jgi:hypothetical protein
MVYLRYTPVHGVECVDASDVPRGARIRDFESFYYAISSAAGPIYALMPAKVAALFLSASGYVETADTVSPCPNSRLH